MLLTFGIVGLWLRMLWTEFVTGRQTTEVLRPCPSSGATWHRQRRQAPALGAGGR